MFSLSEGSGRENWQRVETALDSDRGIDSLMCARSSGSSLWKLGKGNRHNMDKSLS